MRKKLFFFYLVPALITAHSVFAQDQSAVGVEPYVAEEKFIKNNYEGALDDYLSLLEQDPKNEKYNYNIAVCYLNTNINKTKAIPYLEKVTSNTQYDPNAMYLLGRAYDYAYRFDEAISAIQIRK
jgi:predicted Zn-dependent protease